MQIYGCPSSWFWRPGRSREMARSVVAADWGEVPRSHSPACQKPLAMPPQFLVYVRKMKSKIFEIL